MWVRGEATESVCVWRGGDIGFAGWGMGSAVGGHPAKGRCPLCPRLRPNHPTREKTHHAWRTSISLRSQRRLYKFALSPEGKQPKDETDTHNRR